MKKYVIFMFLLSILSIPTFAQQTPQRHDATKAMHSVSKSDDKKSHKGKNMSVAEMTQSQTDDLKTLLQLSNEQTRKLYAILLHGNQIDSVRNMQFDKMRKEQKAQHAAQTEAIKKLLTPQQQAAMNALPAFAWGKDIPDGMNSRHDNGDKKAKDTMKKADKKDNDKGHSTSTKEKK